jgi:hypothetical protein
MGDWEKTEDKHEKSWDQVGWMLWWRHTTASTTSSEFIIYSTAANQEVEQQLEEGGNLHVNILQKQLCCILPSPPSAAGGCVNPSLQTWLCLCQVLIGFSYSTLYSRPYSLSLSGKSTLGSLFYKHLSLLDRFLSESSFKHYKEKSNCGDWCYIL